MINISYDTQEELNLLNKRFPINFDNIIIKDSEEFSDYDLIGLTGIFEGIEVFIYPINQPA